MKNKKIISLMLCLVMLFSFAGCNDVEELIDPFIDEVVVFDINSPDSTSSISDSSSSQEGEVPPEGAEESSSATMSVVDIGIVTPDVEALYDYAYQLYNDIVTYNIGIDEGLGSFNLTINGSAGTYYRVNDKRFTSAADLDKKLKEIFTEECLKTFYDPYRYVDYEGKFYTVVGISDNNMLYAGRSYKLTKQTTMRVFFDITEYNFKKYEDIPKEYTPFTVAPEDVSAYNANVVSFVLEMAENKIDWRFSKFGKVGY